MSAARHGGAMGNLVKFIERLALIIGAVAFCIPTLILENGQG
jgi:hypothetical protein